MCRPRNSSPTRLFIPPTTYHKPCAIFVNLSSKLSTTLTYFMNISLTLRTPFRNLAPISVNCVNHGENLTKFLARWKCDRHGHHRHRHHHGYMREATVPLTNNEKCDIIFLCMRKPHTHSPRPLFVDDVGVESNRQHLGNPSTKPRCPS